MSSPPDWPPSDKNPGAVVNPPPIISAYFILAPANNNPKMLDIDSDSKDK